MDFELTPLGYLRKPHLHDGHVLGLTLEGKDLRLTVSDASGRSFILELVGLQRLRCNEFAQGNIIDHVVITTTAKPPGASFRKLLGELHPSVAEPHRGQHEAWVARCEESVIKGDLTFVELQPSYGCEMWALCESVEVSSLEGAEDADKAGAKGKDTKVTADQASEPIELEITGMHFLSEGDERAFFGRLRELPFVQSCEGRGRTLYVLANSGEVDEHGLRELIALFTRYGIAPRQLRVFDREEFAWFRNEQAYWYNEIFG